MIKNVIVAAIVATFSPHIAAAAVPVLTIDGQNLTEDDLPADLRSQIFDKRQEAHEAVQGLLKHYGARYAAAKEKDKSIKPNAVPSAAELFPAPPPNEADVRKFFEDNKARMPAGASFEQVKGELRDYMTQQLRSQVLSAKLDEVMSAGRMKVLLVPPEAPVIPLDLADFPAKGSANAKVTLVEASDYLCPHCQQEQPEVTAVLKEFGDKIRFVQVNFALRPEGLSGLLAQGAFCARKQGDDVFWRFHNAAFEVATREKLSTGAPADAAKAKQIATAAKVDLAKWEPCLKSEEAKKYVSSSVDRMAAVGVASTPTFFLNGRKLHLDDVTLRQTIAKELGPK